MELGRRRRNTQAFIDLWGFLNSNRDCPLSPLASSDDAGTNSVSDHRKNPAKEIDQARLVRSTGNHHHQQQ